MCGFGGTHLARHRFSSFWAWKNFLIIAKGEGQPKRNPPRID
jgi:hypothetical protein